MAHASGEVSDGTSRSVRLESASMVRMLPLSFLSKVLACGLRPGPASFVHEVAKRAPLARLGFGHLVLVDAEHVGIAGVADRDCHARLELGRDSERFAGAHAIETLH